MSHSLMAKRYFKEYKLVASQVGAIIPILKQTACMSAEKRFEIGCCKAFRKYFSTDKEFKEFLEKTAEPTLKILGHTEWNRDILTDMGLLISLKQGRASLKGL